MKRFDCLGAMIENEYGSYCYAAHADRETDVLRARLDEAEEDMSVQGVRMGEAQETIYALKNALRELCEKMEAGISGPEETKRARTLIES